MLELYSPETARVRGGSFLTAILPNPSSDAVGLDVQVPFYPTSTCQQPMGWSESAVDYCFHAKHIRDQCAALFSDPTNRVLCYCGALSPACGGSAAAQTGHGLMTRCLGEVE